jgi:hypothetical protein
MTYAVPVDTFDMAVVRVAKVKAFRLDRVDPDFQVLKQIRLILCVY